MVAGRTAGLNLAMALPKLLHYLTELPWIVLVSYWFFSALKTRSNRSKESSLSRYRTMLLVIAGYLFLFADWTGIGVLGKRFLPSSIAVMLLGTVLTWMGIALALWARFHLGQYWSARITIKEDHELICTGPYAHLRHPIYSGLLLAMSGTAIEFGQWHCILGTMLVLTAYWFKARKEETLLSAHFGQVFQEYCYCTGFLVPRFR